MKEYTNKKDLLNCLNSLYDAEIINEFEFKQFKEKINREFE